VRGGGHPDRPERPEIRLLHLSQRRELTGLPDTGEPAIFVF
jgi:hypothetical protein